MEKLIKGLQKFQQEVVTSKRAEFEQLAKGQKPSTLFVACADSRVAPEIFTQSEPGEIFVIRNAGNIVPPYGSVIGGVTASIEFAILALGVKNVVVCGHTDCGAMKGVLHPEKLTELPAVASWLKLAEASRRLVRENYANLSEAEALDVMIQENVIAQLENLKTHPAVASRLAKGELNLYGWVYHIANGQVDSYDASEQRFVRLDGTKLPNATPVARLRRRYPAAG
jgi:carbonic anhydrase